MTAVNQAIFVSGFCAALSFLTLVTVVSLHSVETGCYIIGSEINGDYSVEYLGLGNC